MNYAIYPFKRYGKYRLYVVFDDEQNNEIRRSTSVSYLLNATKKEKKEALKKAEHKAHEIIMEYFRGDVGNQNKKSASKDKVKQKLSNYLESYYYPNVKASCQPSTFTSYKNALEHFLRIIGDKLAISDIIVPPISGMLCHSFRESLCHF